MNILFTVDEKGLDRLREEIFSIKYYNERELNIYILHSSISTKAINSFKKYIKDNNLGKITFIKIMASNLRLPLPLKHTTVETYYRLFAPYYLDETIDRILYLDYDIVCTNNLEEFYDMDFDNNIIIGIKDAYIDETENYVNAGVLLIDLKKYRDFVTFDELINYINSNYITLNYQDQTVLNRLFINKINCIEDDYYNYQINAYETEYDYACLIHYINSDKPWNDNYSHPQKAIPYYKVLDLMGNKKRSIELSNYHFKNQFYAMFDPNKYTESETVDIIMPSYNATSTISKTLDSIVNQVLGNIKLIIYLIDDCSSEDYKPIVDAYKDKLDIRYYRLSKNSGVALAREKGIVEGKSKYFTIIDSDDQFISPYAVASMYYAMKDNDVDVVRSIFIEEKNWDLQNYKLYREDNIACHGKLYNRQFIKDNNITYLDLRGNEDTAYNALLKACDAKYYDLSVITYRWCDNPNSFTRKDFLYHEKDLITFSKGFVWTVEEIIKRSDYLQNIEEKISEILAHIYFRIHEPWNDDTRNEMYNNAAKIYLMYRKYTNKSLSSFIINNYIIEDIDDLFYNFLYVIQERMLGLDEYKSLSKEEKIKMGCLYKNKHKESYKVINTKTDLKKYKNIIIGKNSSINLPIILDNFNAKLVIGDNVKISHNLLISGDSDINVGNNVIIDSNVCILTNGHISNFELRDYIYTGPVSIGDGVYIGNNVVINVNTNIGNNVFIDVGSVVLKNIKEKYYANGNPCEERNLIDTFDEYFYNNDLKIDYDE